MKYFFIPGNNPELSLAELISVFPQAEITFNKKNIIILVSSKQIRPEFIKKLGGIIKFGIVLQEKIKKPELNAQFLFNFIRYKETKYVFGISFYGVKNINQKKIGIELKKEVKNSGRACRWVVSKEKTLSSVVITQNKILEKGDEFVVFEDGGGLSVGRTLAVQDFKFLSKRDYGRPARDSYSGMLPPKLAQIMINLAQANPEDTILDPFCGSGTILSEAMLLGFKNIIGSDLSQKAIKDSQDNIDWLAQKKKIKIKYQLMQIDVRKLSQKINKNSIDKIITEPYLGPQRSYVDFKQSAQELNSLYSQALSEFNKILKKNGRVVMIWPIFKAKNKTQYLSPNINNFKIINLLNNEERGIVYGRAGQKVWREIIILEKK